MNQYETNLVGYFKPTDPGINGIKYGNWGSRPYEYFWAAVVVDVTNKRVLDVGTGLPSEHNWNEFVRSQLKPKSYLGIDIDLRLKDEEINEENHKMLYMDMANLQLDDNSIDVIYSISTFEHIDNVDVFMKCMKEGHRVLDKGGKMVVTLDEIWNIANKDTQHSSWNELEKVLVKENKFSKKDVSFGMVDFSELISQWFEPVDIIIQKNDADTNLLHHPLWNSTVSYGVFNVKK
jgi:ubiquinone/menaquinone biosynthesis C-methylase UbiE